MHQLAATLLAHARKNQHFSFVGALGRGPKYLTDEYAVMDIRYWPTDDPWLTWIAYMELIAYVPLCYFW